MANNLDDIFSPERLRQRWQQPEAATEKKGEKGSEPPGPQPPFALFERLRSRIQERFPGEKGYPLALLMNELGELLRRRFPQTEDSEVPAEDRAALNQEIETLLSEIEDLAEALEL